MNRGLHLSLDRLLVRVLEWYSILGSRLAAVAGP